VPPRSPISLCRLSFFFMGEIIVVCWGNFVLSVFCWRHPCTNYIIVNISRNPQEILFLFSPEGGEGDFPYPHAYVTALVFVSLFFCRGYLFGRCTWLCGGFQIVTQRTCL